MTTPRLQSLQHFGDVLVDVFHFLALFIIGGTVVWSAIHEYVGMMQHGYATLRDILLLFIYLEIGAMTGIYFRTRQLPVQFLIYIAITALSRHLVLDSKAALEAHHEMVLLVVSGCILLLAVAVLVLGIATRRGSQPEA
jgi:phosphate starvation-inducible membrane PsiE